MAPLLLAPGGAQWLWRHHHPVSEGQPTIKLHKAIYNCNFVQFTQGGPVAALLWVLCKVYVLEHGCWCHRALLSWILVPTGVLCHVCCSGAKQNCLKFGFASLFALFALVLPGFFPSLEFRQEELLCALEPRCQRVRCHAPGTLEPGCCSAGVIWRLIQKILGVSAFPESVLAQFSRTRRWERPMYSLWMPKTKRSSALDSD